MPAFCRKSGRIAEGVFLASTAKSSPGKLKQRRPECRRVALFALEAPAQQLIGLVGREPQADASIVATHDKFIGTRQGSFLGRLAETQQLCDRLDI